MIQRNTKVCLACLEIQQISNFYKNKTTKDRHSNYCKVCQKRLYGRPICPRVYCKSLDIKRLGIKEFMCRDCCTLFRTDLVKKIR